MSINREMIIAASGWDGNNPRTEVRGFGWGNGRRTEVRIARFSPPFAQSQTERGADLSPHRVTTAITEAPCFNTGIFTLRQPLSLLRELGEGVFQFLAQLTRFLHPHPLLFNQALGALG